MITIKRVFLMAILFSFVFLYLVFAGGGEWSVDAQIARRRSIA
jgi:uncharacterized membrane protein YphA (DoxX/SURF4 family)